MAANAVREALNSAITSSSVEDKLLYLVAAKESLIHSVEKIEKTEFIELASELISPGFQLDTSQDIRRFVLQVVEDLCRTPGTNTSLLIKPVETLALMLEDENQPDQIARWALTVAAKTWKCILYVLANNNKNEQESKILKTMLWRVKSAGLELLTRRRDKSCRINAIKFVEIVSLTLCMPMSAKEKKGTNQLSIAPQFESLRDAPHFHPSLPSIFELANEGLECVKQLIHLLLGEIQPTSIRTACCNSLSLIAKTRPETRDVIVDAMITACSTSDTAVQQSLKTNAIMMLKGIAPDEKSLENPFVPKLTQILKVLKAEEHLNRYLAPLEKKKRVLDAEAKELERRLKDWPPGSNKFPTEGLHLLPNETLARLLVDNAMNVPDSPPPRANVAYHPPRLMIGPTGIPAGLERVMAQIRAVETGRGGLNLPKPLQDCRAIPLDSEQLLKQREGAFLRVVKSSLESLQVRSGSGWGPKSHEACGIVSARLACDFQDISEEGGELREKLMENLLIHRPSDIQDKEEISAIAALHVEYAADKLSKDKTNKLRYEDFLNTLVKRIRDNDVKFESHKRLGKILTQAPALPNSTIKIIVEMCEDPVYFVLYFQILKELLLFRPINRQLLLQVVLNHATRSNPIRTPPERTPERDSRTLGFNLTAGILYKQLGPMYCEIMKNFALETLLSLNLQLNQIPDCVITARKITANILENSSSSSLTVSTTTTTTSSKEDPIRSEVISRIQLFLALCAADSKLVSELFDAYATIKQKFQADVANNPDKENVRKMAVIFDIFHFETGKLWRSLDGKNPVQSIAMLQDFAPGAEDLVLIAADTFSKDFPSQALEPILALRTRGGVDPIYESDPRFLIPVIGSLGRDEALSALTRIATELPKDLVEKSISNLVNGEVGRSIDASDLLLLLANLQINIEALINATDALLNNQNVIDEMVMRKVFNEMIEQERYPVVMLRIVIRGYQSFPNLKQDALHVLARLAEREVWNMAELWAGFQYLALLLKPDSFELILRLPDEGFAKFVKDDTTKNLRELLKRAALTIMIAEKEGKGDTSMETEPQDIDESGEPITRQTKKKQALELSAFAKEYLGL